MTQIHDGDEPSAVDVFVSYANEDRERARLLASALQDRGFSVWWDRRILAGQTFDEVIEHQLETAKSVVVLWSKDSIASDWVKNEASVASERRRLVPARLDEINPPLEFRRIQTADLVGWDGNPSHAAFLALCDGITAKVGVPRVVAQGSGVTRTSGLRLLRPRTLSVIAGVPVLVALALYGSPRQREELGRGERTDSAAARAHAPKIMPAEVHGIDNPLPLRPGVTYRTTLERNDESFFRLSSPARELRVVLDMRRADGKKGNLQSALSVLGGDGEVVQANVIRFNEIAVRHRLTAGLSSPAPTLAGFKLLNMHSAADFWLTVLEGPAPRLLPFFGDVVPKPLALEESVSGVLDTHEDVFYTTTLTRGGYKVVVDFSSVDRRRTNIQGYLALLDSDGGNERTIVGFNEIDVSFRKTSTFRARADGPLLTRIHNSSHAVKYTVRLVREE